jgi:hypothetical protein
MVITIPFVPPTLAQTRIPFGTDISGPTQNIFTNIANYFKNFDFQSLVSNLHTIGIVLTIIFGIVFIIIIFKMRGLIAEKVSEIEGEISPPTDRPTASDNRWEEIKRHVNDFKESSWKLAIIEADKFVDTALKNGGFQGESMGERLMTIEPGQLLSLQGLWDAHKLRNLLVHDVEYVVTHRQAILAIEAFEQVLRELGALA